MAVITGERLLERWRERLQRSDAADIAVAWATPCPAVDELREFCDRGGELRIVVGLAGNATDPITLKELSKRAELRIGEASGGIFHPKYYCFRSSSRSTVWVGSANLTRAGFGANNELMLKNAGTKGSGAWSVRIDAHRFPGAVVVPGQRLRRNEAAVQKQFLASGRCQVAARSQ